MVPVYGDLKKGMVKIKITYTRQQWDKFDKLSLAWKGDQNEKMRIPKHQGESTTHTSAVLYGNENGKNKYGLHICVLLNSLFGT